MKIQIPFISNLFKQEKRSTDYTYPVSFSFNGTTSYKSSQAMRLSAVYRCVQILSDSVASLVMEPFEIKDGYKRKMVESPLFPLLTIEPNEFTSRYMFFKNMVAQMLLNGNAYVLIERSGRLVKSLRLINSTEVQILITGNDIKYKHLLTNKTYNKADVIHLHNFTVDGINGISVIEHAVYSLQLSADSEAHARGYFQNGASMGGMLKSDKVLTKEKKDEFRESFRQAFNTVDGQPNGIAVLDMGTDYLPISVKPSDSQLLETRKFNITDIARFFGVHPSKLYDSQGTTYSNVENFQLAFLTDTLQPLLEKIENEFHRKLFLPSERVSTELKFDVSNLLRADSLSQADYYTKMYQLGVYTTNEIRQKLNMPAVEGGNQPFIQVNLQKLDEPITAQSQTLDNKFKQ